MAIDVASPGASEAALKSALNALVPSAQTIEVTTGAAPVNISLSDYENWMTLVILVTSGGTEGVEVLNFVGPTDGAQANETVGKTINVVFSHQTHEDDEIHITQNTTGVFECLDNLGNGIGSFDTGIFNLEGNNIIFGFTGDIILQYRLCCIYGSYDNATVIAGQRYPLPQGGAFGDIPYANGSGGGASWGASSPVPIRVYNAGSVDGLNSGFPPGSYPGAMAMVSNADTPVLGSVVVSGGSSQCVVISNGADYLVMFIFP